MKVETRWAYVRKRMLDRTERALGAARHRVSSLYEGLLASEDAETGHGTRAVDSGVSISAGTPCRTAGDSGTGDVDPLDPDLSPSENAEKAFRRYRKLRDARARIPDLLESAETEVGRLEDLATFVRLAESEGELRDLERSLDRVQPEVRRPVSARSVGDRRGSTGMDYL